MAAAAGGGAGYAGMIMQGVQMMQSMQGDKGGGEPAAGGNVPLGQAAPTSGRSADWFKAVEGLGEKHRDDSRGY